MTFYWGQSDRDFYREQLRFYRRVALLTATTAPFAVLPPRCRVMRPAGTIWSWLTWWPWQTRRLRRAGYVRTGRGVWSYPGPDRLWAGGRTNHAARTPDRPDPPPEHP